MLVSVGGGYARSSRTKSPNKLNLKKKAAQESLGGFFCVQIVRVALSSGCAGFVQAILSFAFSELVQIAKAIGLFCLIALHVLNERSDRTSVTKSRDRTNEVIDRDLPRGAISSMLHALCLFLIQLFHIGQILRLGVLGANG